MSFSYNKILNIPDRAIISKKISKSFFIRNFELSSADKKILNEIITMEWLASIKPSNSNIAVVQNEFYIFEEIQIMTCTVSGNLIKGTIDKVANLFQKHIPYPIVLVVENTDEFVVNVCEKKINQIDKSKRTIDAFVTSPNVSKLYKNELVNAFFKALNFAILDKTNLETTYKSYTSSIVQFQTAMVTGTFNKRSSIRTEDDLKHLETIQRIEKEIITLSNQIKKETQFNIKVSLNIDIQRKRNEIENIKNLLNTL
jgi:predicted amino acid-binding ACT domain protein